MMNTVLIVCAIVVTASIVVLVVFLVRTLIQVRRTALQAELVMKQVNEDIGIIGTIAGNISQIVSWFSSPWMKVGGIFSALASGMIMKHRKQAVPEREREQEKVHA